MKIGIIGMGAAGMMAASQILESDFAGELLLFEKNSKIGNKVLISGGGRCNVTTGIHDLGEVLKKYPRGAKFLRYAFHEFGPESVYNWFEDHGVKLKTESDLRVFPASDDGHDVVGVFENIFLNNQNCSLLLNSNVIEVIKVDEGFEVNCKDGSTYVLDKLILTTGGQAFRHTGSTGDGYSFAEKLGHSITKLGPSLNSFILKEDWVKELAGVSHKHVVFKASLEGKRIAFEGPCIWTHKGKSGPAIFAMSSLLAFAEFSKDSPFDLFIDLYPQMDQESLKNEILKFKDINYKKLFKNAFTGIIPKRMVEVFFNTLGISLDVLCSEIKNKEIFRLIETIKNCKVSIIGRGKGDEFVTAGGVRTKEIDSNTMESRICPNLFFAGELVDIDGFTGGFNLQASWATGFLAGNNAKKSCN
mgnify:CR=1 FL=1